MQVHETGHNLYVSYFWNPSYLLFSFLRLNFYSTPSTFPASSFWGSRRWQLFWSRKLDLDSSEASNGLGVAKFRYLSTPQTCSMGNPLYGDDDGKMYFSVSLFIIFLKYLSELWNLLSCYVALIPQTRFNVFQRCKNVAVTNQSPSNNSDQWMVQFTRLYNGQWHLNKSPNLWNDWSGGVLLARWWEYW